eukprot:c52289_g1_i1 orf=106-324(-)
MWSMQRRGGGTNYNVKHLLGGRGSSGKSTKDGGLVGGRERNPGLAGGNELEDLGAPQNHEVSRITNWDQYHY